MNTRISSLPYFTTFYYHLCSIGGAASSFRLLVGLEGPTVVGREETAKESFFPSSLPGRSSSQQAPSLQPLSPGSGIPPTIVPPRLIVVIRPQLSTALFLVVS